MKATNTQTIDQELEGMLAKLDARSCLACGATDAEFSTRFSRTCTGCAEELAADYDAWMQMQLDSRHLAGIPFAAPWEIEWAMKGGPQ